MLLKTFKFSCEKSTQPEQIRIIGQPNYTPRKESVLEAYVNSEPKWNTTLLSKYLGIHYMQIANKFMDFFHASQVNIHPTCLGFVCYTSWFKRLSETMEYGFYSNFFLDKYHLIIWEEHKIWRNLTLRFDITKCRECISTGAAGEQTRRSLGHHLLHPLILRLFVLCTPADFEAQISLL